MYFLKSLVKTKNRCSDIFLVLQPNFFSEDVNLYNQRLIHMRHLLPKSGATLYKLIKISAHGSLIRK